MLPVMAGLNVVDHQTAANTLLETIMQKLVIKSYAGEEYVASWTLYNAFLAESKEALFVALTDRLQEICDDWSRNDWLKRVPPEFVYDGRIMDVRHLIFASVDSKARTVEGTYIYDTPDIYTLDELFDNLD